MNHATVDDSTIHSGDGSRAYCLVCECDPKEEGSSRQNLALTQPSESCQVVTLPALDSGLLHLLSTRKNLIVNEQTAAY